MSDAFDIGCTRCPRLATFLAEVREAYPDYHGRPVPAFGERDARLLIIGLAPGMHGANATGRPFTGDYAGILLYKTLHALGLANQRDAVSADDGMRLAGCRITNAVKCLPPQNKPVGSEINECNRFLAAEFRALPASPVVLALGGIAHNAVLKAVGVRQSAHRFGHAAEHALPGDMTLVDSYHCSRYNTQTRRLTEDMFYDVVARAASLAGLRDD